MLVGVLGSGSTLGVKLLSLSSKWACRKRAEASHVSSFTPGLWTSSQVLSSRTLQGRCYYLPPFSRWENWRGKKHERTMYSVGIMTRIWTEMRRLKVLLNIGHQLCAPTFPLAYVTIRPGGWLCFPSRRKFARYHGVSQLQVRWRSREGRQTFFSKRIWGRDVEF